VLTIIGTVPDEAFPLVETSAGLESGERLCCDGRMVPVLRGTPALVAAAAMAARFLGRPAPRVLLAGDCGTGHGSRALYAHLTESLASDTSDILVFHYLLPDVDWHNRILLAIEDRASRPLLVADAGYMYAAKMSGQAAEYDLFTPDVGELAFLADEQAPHPFYTRGFLLQEEDNVPGFVARAYQYDNAARHLLIKGRVDRLANATGILASVDEPVCPVMEAIGGTGDTLTGLVAGLLHAGLTMERAALLAARANRLAGVLCDPTPATQIAALIERIPQALEQVLAEAG
jgi:NAD(P)H-hydrate repair Nnr-like enzyme with NAD(P)H-hydrate dehydratase domain